MAEFTGTALPLSEQGLDQTANALQVGAAEIWTVLSVETRGCGFLSDRRPLVLFERHVFHRQTQGRFDATNPQISSSEPGGYFGGVREYDRLAAAVKLDRHAALNSTSWGIGQVMGFNAEHAGFPSAEAMVAAMLQSEDAQLAAMARFLQSERLAQPLAQHDWAGFARGYNGPNFQKNQYDTRLAGQFQKFSRGPLPDLSVRQAQVWLTFLGLNPGVVDGVIGRFTRSAIVEFRKQNGLGTSDAVDDALLTNLRGKVDVLASAASA